MTKRATTGMHEFGVADFGEVVVGICGGFNVFRGLGVWGGFLLGESSSVEAIVGDAYVASAAMGGLDGVDMSIKSYYPMIAYHCHDVSFIVYGVFV